MPGGSVSTKESSTELSGKFRIGLIAKGNNEWLGGSQYIKNIVFALSELDDRLKDKLELSVIVDSKEQGDHFHQLVDGLAKIVHSESIQRPYTFKNRCVWFLRRKLTSALNPRFEDALEDNGYDFVYPLLVHKKRRLKYRTASWIPDFQYDSFPEGSNEAEIQQRKKDSREITMCSKKLVLSSERARQQCQQLFPKHESELFVYNFRVFIKQPKTSDCKTDKTVLSTYHLPERYFVVSNLFAPTKNHKAIIQALGLLSKESIFPNFVFTGNLYDNRNPGFVNSIFRWIAENGVQRQITILGVLPKSDQLMLLSNSLAIVQPSLFEGWSTVVEEAHCLGKKLIVSDIAVHREQNVPGAVYFDARDPGNLAAILKQEWDKQDKGNSDQGCLHPAYRELQKKAGLDFLLLATEGTSLAQDVRHISDTATQP